MGIPALCGLTYPCGSPFSFPRRSRHGPSGPRRKCGVRRREPLCGATGVYQIKGAPAALCAVKNKTALLRRAASAASDAGSPHFGRPESIKSRGPRCAVRSEEQNGASAPRRECGVRRREPAFRATGVYQIAGPPLRCAQWGTKKRWWGRPSFRPEGGIFRPRAVRGMILRPRWNVFRKSKKQKAPFRALFLNFSKKLRD